jgi:hypothetical protein
MVKSVHATIRTTSNIRYRSLSFDGKKCTHKVYTQRMLRYATTSKLRYRSMVKKCTRNDNYDSNIFNIVPYRSMAKKCTHKVYTPTHATIRTTSNIRYRSLSFDGKKCTRYDTLRQANFAIVPYRSMVKKCTHMSRHDTLSFYVIHAFVCFFVLLYFL